MYPLLTYIPSACTLLSGHALTLDGPVYVLQGKVRQTRKHAHEHRTISFGCPSGNGEFSELILLSTDLLRAAILTKNHSNISLRDVKALVQISSKHGCQHCGKSEFCHARVSSFPDCSLFGWSTSPLASHQPCCAESSQWLPTWKPSSHDLC